jgi:filamentous hemagglutinin family protein
MMFRLNKLAMAIAIVSCLNQAQALPLNALPTGGQTAQGQASIQQSANQMQINQSSPKAVINWDTFNIGKDAGVTFIQPNAQASILNRVTNGSSEIAGQINANGQVYLLNPNGILFSPTAQVNTTSLVVATGDLSDADYLNGHGTIHNSTNGTISNQGNLTVAQGGKIILSSQQVNNAGHITAKQGQVQLLAGQSTRVNITADGLIAAELDVDNSNTANINNSGTISATGGRVDVLAAGANSHITHTGIIEAQSTVTRDGKIYLVAGYQGEGVAPKSGEAEINGQLDVSAPFGGNGGLVETSADHINIGDHTHVTSAAPLGKTGLWFIDPQDFTIAASGGDISGATLSTMLSGNTNVTIASSSGANSAGSGDINVNDNVSWNANQLTLTAAKDININAVLSVNGSLRGGSGTLVLNTATANGADAGVAGGLLNFGLTPTGFTGRVDFALGGQGLLTINGISYWIANDINSLQNIVALSSTTSPFVGNFAIGQNIDATTTSTMNGGLGFAPLALGGVALEGLGHVIDGLTINRPTQSQVGLIGAANGTAVSNLGLTNVNITGHDDVGALLGHSDTAVVSSFVTGSITATTGNAGGLIGSNDGGNVTNSFALGTVTGTDNVGGLVGMNDNTQIKIGQINHSYARGSVNGANDVGGLVGLSQDGIIHGSYATSDVTATGNEAGGLVGGNTTQGGAIGNINIIDTSYATGSVTGQARAGGLVGYNQVNVSNSYATGKTTGSTDVGGLIGLHLGDINNSYWDTQATVQANPIGTNNGTTANLTGLTTVQMHQLSSFANFGTSIDAGGTTAVWRIYDGNTAPLLRYFLTPITVTVNSIANSHPTLVYNGANQTFSFQTTQSYSNPLGASLSGDPTTLLTANGTNAGNYGATLNQNALYSNQQGFDISLVDRTTANTNLLTISPAPLVISTNDVNRVYDGTTGAAGTAIAVSNTQLLGTDFLSGGTFIFDNKNVGNNKTITTSNVTVNDANGGNNYTVTYANNTTSQVTPATLTVSATANNKVYDATTAAATSLTDDRISGDVLSVGTTGAAFADKNVGNAKVVTVNGLTLSGTDAGNYTLTATTATAAADITPATLTVSATANNKVYDATTAAATSLTDDRISGDVLSVGTTGAAFADKNVGNAKVVTVNGLTLTGTDAANYTLAATTATAAADITPATLTVSATANNKVYDATTAAATSLTDDRLTGDVLSVGTTGAAFADKNVGNAKVVTVNGLTLSGTDAGNYTLAATTATAAADITPATLTVSASANNKVYDASTAATASLTDDRLTGDVLSVSTTGAAFADKNVGNAKVVMVNGVSLSGTDAANYILSTAAVTSTADITPATLTVSATANNKVYDASTAAATALTDDRFSGDVLTLKTSGSAFADKNVGNDKTVTVNGLTLSGTDAANYTLSTAAVTSTADITPATLTVSATANNKVYDASTAAATALTDDRFSGDVLTLKTSGSAFSDKNVGNAKVVTVNGLTLSGTDAGNYTLAATTATAAADITPATLTVSASANNKVYDASTAATASLTDDRLTGDVLSVSTTGAAFANKNVGNDKTVTVNGLTLSGTDAANYTLAASPVTATANITPATLTVSANANNKIYDASTAATASFTDDRLSGDVLSVSTTGAAFANKNVGNEKTVTVNGVTLTGADAANYTLAAATLTSTANITPATLTVSASANNKVYDASTAAATALTDDRFSGDVLTLKTSGSAFSDKNVGNEKTVTVNGVTLSGTDAANYILATSPVTATANITPATLTVSATADNKVYDATTAATTALSDNRFEGDVLTIHTSGATFANKNVGNEKTVTVNGLTLSGTDAANYTVDQEAPITAIANITPATLTVTATADNKIYNASTAAATSLADNRFEGDVLTIHTTGANFSNKNVGNEKTVTVNGLTLSGTDAANYTLHTASVTATADITPATLTVSATAANKTFDNSTAAVASITDNRFSGDVVTVNTTGADFANKYVGNNKTVTVNGLTLTGADAANYRLALPVTAKADIEGLPTDAVESKLAFSCGEFGICPVVIPSINIKPIFDVYLPPALQDCESQDLRTTPADCILQPKRKIQITTASDDDGQAATPIQSKRALIIANSNYQNVGPLAGVKKDSQAIQQELAQLGYQVTVVDDASRAEMITVLNQMIQQSNRDDSVLIYYAGHGYVNNGSSVGYWLPTDARIDHGEQWISTLDVARFIHNIAAKQILLVSDSCFSGSLSYETALQRKTELDKNAVLKRRSVMVLTSGSEEPVADAGTTGLSPFAASFVQSIRLVPKDNDLRGQNLYKNVYQQVTSRFKQYPTYGGLDSAGNMLGGEYIFEKK